LGALFDGVKTGGDEEPLARVEEALGAFAFRDEEEIGHRVQRGILTLGRGQGGDPGKRVEAVRTTVLIEGREIPDAVLQPVLAMDGRLGEVLALHVEDDRRA